MRIGDYLIVEFGLTGNACFVYQYDSLPPDIKRRLNSAVHGAQIDIDTLKVRGHKPRLTHLGGWEDIFDRTICPLLGFRPPAQRKKQLSQTSSKSRSFVVVNKGAPGSVKPARTYGGVGVFSRLEFEKVMAEHRLMIDDFRMNGGSLWVRTDEADLRISTQLRAWGFAYKIGKGWWKE